MKTTTMNESELRTWGEHLGRSFHGGECVELIGDVGAGKTTLTKAIAVGMGIEEDVQSPTFTLSRIYETDTLALHHYDFYRLNEAGVMSYELAESIAAPRVVTVIEWADTVADVLPPERLVITLRSTPHGEARLIAVNAPPSWGYLSI